MTKFWSESFLSLTTGDKSDENIYVTKRTLTWYISLGYDDSSTPTLIHHLKPGEITRKTEELITLK